MIIKFWGSPTVETPELGLHALPFLSLCLSLTHPPPSSPGAKFYSELFTTPPCSLVIPVPTHPLHSQYHLSGFLVGFPASFATLFPNARQCCQIPLPSIAVPDTVLQKYADRMKSMVVGVIIIIIIIGQCSDFFHKAKYFTFEELLFFFCKMFFLFQEMIITIVGCSLNGHEFFPVCWCLRKVISSSSKRRNPFLHLLNLGLLV